MPNFPSHILTNAGRALIADAHLGRKLTFTRLKVGSGASTNGTVGLTDLVNPRLDVEITGMSRDATNDNWVKIRSQFNNVNLTTPFTFTEIGVFAQTESLPETLYSYASTNQGDNIPAYDGANPVIVYPTVIVIIDRTIEIEATIVIGIDVSCENIGLPGTGAGIYSHRQGDTFMFRRLTGGIGIELVETAGIINISERRLAIDLDLYVPLTNPEGTPATRFATIQAAWDSLAQTTIPTDRQATIHVAAGRYTLNTPLILRHPQSNRINIIGADPVLIPLTAQTTTWAVNTAGNQRANLTMSTGNAAQIAVGDIISIRAGGADTYILQGAYQVMSKPSGTQIQIRSASPWAAMPAPNTGSASQIYWYPSLIQTASRFNADTIKIGSPGIKLFKNFGICDNWKAAPPYEYMTIDIRDAPASAVLENLALSQGDYQLIYAAGSGVDVIATNIFLGDANGGFLIARNAVVELTGLYIAPEWTSGLHAYSGGTIIGRDIRVVGCGTSGLLAFTTGKFILESGIYSTQNAVGLDANFGSYISVGQVPAQFWNNTTDIKANDGSTITVDPGTTATTFSPPVNTVGNRNSIIAR